MAKKTYILDTSVYLTGADAILAFKNNDILIPLKVLEEIDKHKSRQDGVGAQARKIIRTLDSLRSKGTIHENKQKTISKNNQRRVDKSPQRRTS